MSIRSNFSYLCKSRFMGMAHRGASALSLENTLDAFYAAYKLGFKNFELDVHSSKDGEVFVCHDDNLKRMIGEDLLLSNLSSSDIRLLEVTYGYKIPTLLQILEKFPDAQLNIDAKSWKVINPLCQVIKTTKAYNRICIGSFSDLRVRKVIKNLNQLVCYSPGPLGCMYFYFCFLTNLTPKLKAGCLQLPESFLGHSFLSKDFVEFAHKSGLLVHIWTINEESRMRALIEIGVDGIMTDNCVGLKKVMKEYSLWGV